MVTHSVSRGWWYYRKIWENDKQPPCSPTPSPRRPHFYRLPAGMHRWMMYLAWIYGGGLDSGSRISTPDQNWKNRSGVLYHCQRGFLTKQSWGESQRGCAGQIDRPRGRPRIWPMWYVWYFHTYLPSSPYAALIDLIDIYRLAYGREWPVSLGNDIH